MAEKENKAEETPKAKFDKQKFIERKLKCINNMANKAKARELAESLLNR